MERADLHIHTTASDGTYTTDQVIEMAKAEGLSAIAITDHDTIDGVPGKSPEGIELVPGIEFSTKFMTKTHILGYFIDPDNAELKAQLKFMVEDRDARNEKIAALMKADGIKLDYADMKVRFGGVVGQPHFAQLMVEQGYAGSINEAFEKFIGRGNKYWAPRTTTPLERCVELIINAGGTAVLAHPFEYKYEKNSLTELIEFCMKCGVKGLECRHPSHTPGQMAYLERLAEDYGLAKTGGSDFHGEHKPDVKIGSGRGTVCVPASWLDSLRSRC